MATSVTIEIHVDSGQAQAAIDALNKLLKQAGVSGTAAMQQASAGVKQLGGHSATALDSVRLLSQEFGLRLPRALEAMISRNAALVSGLQGLIGVMATIAAAEVFVHVAMEIKHAYDEYISLNAVAEKYYETLKKTRDADFGGARNIDTATLRREQATASAASLRQQAEALHAKGTAELTNPMMMNPIAGAVDLKQAHDLMVQSYEAQAKLNAATQNEVALKHESIVADINLKHAADERLQGAAKNNAELAKTVALNAENQKYNQALDRAAGNTVATNAGQKERDIADATARAQTAAQNANLSREEAATKKKEAQEAALAIMKADDQVVQASLEGEALYRRQREDGIREITMQLKDQGRGEQQVLAETAALSAKLDGEHEDRLQKQYQEAQRTLRAAQQAGLKPRDRATAEFEDKLQNINTDRSLADNPDAASALRLAAHTEMAQKVAALDEQDEAKRQQRELANNAEDLQYAQEAARAEARVKEDGLLGWVAGYKNAIAAINDEDARRTAKLQEEAAKQGLTDKEVAQRKIDIDRTASAEIAQQNQELQHKIAGDLQQAFTDPVHFIKAQMEKMFFEILAAWLMRLNVFKGAFGSAMGGIMPGGAGAGGGAGSTIGNILRGTTGAFGGSPQLQGYGNASSTNSGGGFGGGGSTSGGGIGSDISTGLGAAKTISSIPGVGKLLGFGGGDTAPVGASGAGAGFSLDDSTDSGLTSTIPDLPMPDVSPDLASIGGFGPATGGSSAGGSGAAGALGLIGGEYQLYSGAYNAFENSDILGGLSSGAEGGAAIGTAIAPGIGTVIGAAVGAGVGGIAGIFGTLFGQGAKHKARDYYKQSIRPQLDAAAQNTSYGNYQTAISSVNSISGQGLLYMDTKFGKDAGNWVNNKYMKKYVDTIDTMILSSTAGGREYTGLSAKQFHSGGRIGGFGSFATSSSEGYIHAMLGETVMSPSASSTHSSMLAAMNAGASANDVASAYLASSGSMTAASSGGGSRDIHVHTLDPKTMEHWLRHGGAKMITKHQNDYSGSYAGDGIGG